MLMHWKATKNRQKLDGIQIFTEVCKTERLNHKQKARLLVARHVRGCIYHWWSSERVRGEIPERREQQRMRFPNLQKTYNQILG